jgi:hypothetical protein
MLGPNPKPVPLSSRTEIAVLNVGPVGTVVGGGVVDGGGLVVDGLGGGHRTRGPIFTWGCTHGSLACADDAANGTAAIVMNPSADTMITTRRRMRGRRRNTRAGDSIFDAMPFVA